MSSPESSEFLQPPSQPQNTSLALSRLRLPPQSIEAEQAVLGGVLIDNHSFDDVADLVGEGDFYRHDHRMIWTQILRIRADGAPADVLTVADALKSVGRLDDVGGIPYLDSLARGVASAANLKSYAQIVRDHSILRRLISVSEAITTDALEPDGRAVAEILDSAESRILQVKEDGRRDRQDFQAIGSLLGSVYDRLKELHSVENPSEVTGVPTGFRDLDLMTSGLQDGDLIIVAARPSVGKTALALNIGEHVAVHEGLPVAVFSMEMGAEQLTTRVIGSMGRINQSLLKNGRLSEDDWSRLADAVMRLKSAALYIDETPALNPIDLRARARRLARSYGKLGLIIVDYLQLMVSATGARENRATEVAEISRSLKALAKELKCPVIALSQVSRKVEERSDKKPMMSDLRESGSIEQDADLILFIHRDDRYDPESDNKGMVELIIGKNRNGPIGSVTLTFKGEYTRFDNFAAYP